VSEVSQVVEATDLEPLDGKHHLYCKRCYPDFVVRPLGAPLGVPFTAVCGVRAVILARWQSDATPPGACDVCADPSTPCSICGSL
jgi:hypothetical protein